MFQISKYEDSFNHVDAFELSCYHNSYLPVSDFQYLAKTFFDGFLPACCKTERTKVDNQTENPNQ